MPKDRRIIAGAMSGTSADGVDVALVDITGHGLEMTSQVLGWKHRNYSVELKRKIWGIRARKMVELGELAEVGREISLCYAAAVNETLVGHGMNAESLAAVAAHGQTLYHEAPRTIQWLDPALLAAEVGCDVVSDFRRADCAAGGQGAPLVPLADYLLFRDAQKSRVLLNVGGIANITFLGAGAGIDRLIAFDTGPGNCVMDYLVREEDAGGAGFDEGGEIAESGQAIDSLVEKVLGDSYFAKRPPKSTDGPGMIGVFSAAIQKMGGALSLRDLLRSACVISAESIVRGIRQFCPVFPDEIIVSGGGAENSTLMSLLKKLLGSVPLKTTDEMGIASGAKEAVAFALLGAATLDGVAGNVPSATGARRGVVLGSITPKP